MSVTHPEQIVYVNGGAPRTLAEVLDSVTTFTAVGTGAIGRAVGSKLADIVSVKDYGAKGDNSTDDTAAVALAYNAVRTNGGTIYFPPGQYLLNLIIADCNIAILGAGRGANGGTHTYFGGPVGGTILKPKDLTKPVIQIGNGTNKVNAVTLRDFTVLGDSSADGSMVYTAGTSTSDGIVQIGAHYVTIANVDIMFMGGDGYRVTSSATLPSYWTTLSAVNVAGCGLVGLHFVYGPTWVTTINLIGGSTWSLGSGAGTYALRTEGVGVNSSGFWAEAQVSGHLAYLDYDASRAIPPLWFGTGTTNLDSGSSTDTLMEINTTGSSIPTRRVTTLFTGGLSIDGQVKWTADGVLVPKSSGAAKVGNTTVLGQLSFNANLLDSKDEPATATRIMQGGGSVGNETIDLTTTGLRIPGTYQYPVRFANKGGALFQGDTGSGLRFSPSGTPAGEGNGQSISTVRFVATYSGGIIIDLVNGNWVFLAATNGTAFSIGAPTSGGKPLTTGDRISFTISNTSGGALGTLTWNAVYKMAAWTQPATGFNRTITFQYDGTNWIEISRTPADVPN